MHWAGEPSGRVGRGGNVVNMSETRWIVPSKPYTRPKGSWESAEFCILMGIGVVAILFCLFIVGWSAVA